jgi:DNA-binding XRE family transcriptional regulator
VVATLAGAALALTGRTRIVVIQQYWCQQLCYFSPRLEFFNGFGTLHSHWRLPPTMTPSQCKAARALLGLSQERLAAAAEVSPTTVTNFEIEKSVPQRSTLRAMQRALEAAGIEFQDGDAQGVRLKPR